MQVRAQRLALGTAGEVRLQLRGLRDAEFAVVVGLHQQPEFFVLRVAHAQESSAGSRSARRARHSRDITVPSGTPITRDMSR